VAGTVGVKEINKQKLELAEDEGLDTHARFRVGVLDKGMECGWPLKLEKGGAIVVGKAVPRPKEDVQQQTEGADGFIKGKGRLGEKERFGTERVLFGKGGGRMTMKGEVVAENQGLGGSTGAASTVRDLKRLEAFGEVVGITGTKGAAEGELGDGLGDDRRNRCGSVNVESPVIHLLGNGFTTGFGGGVGKECPKGRKEIFRGNLAE
jgi:hypothetical protein